MATENIPTHLEERIQKEYPDDIAILTKLHPNVSDEGIYNLQGRNYNYQQVARFGVKIALEEQWIKCSDRLPEQRSRVLASDGHTCEVLDYKHNCWFRDLDQINGVKYWQPIVPPKPKE